MKILTAIYTIKKGGYYDRFLMMIEALLERNCEVHCISLRPIPVKNPFFHNYIVFYPFQNKESLLSKIIVLGFFPLCSIWIGLKNKIDTIIAFGSLYAFILGFTKLFLKKPMITLIRLSFSFGFSLKDSSNRFYLLNKIIESVGILFSDRIITNYKITTKDNILRIKRRHVKIDTLFNNIPEINNNKKNKKEERYQIKKQNGIPEEAKLIVTAGIITKRKNLELVIKCLSQINKKNIYFIIVGDCFSKTDNNYKMKLVNLAKILEVDNQIIFTGWINKEELWRIYVGSDIFILSSLKEGMPNALLEALGLGLPCIGSRIPGIQDVLKYDELLFDPLNEEILAQKVRDILFDHHSLKRVKTLCEERKKEFIFDWKERVFQIITNEVSSVKVS